MYADAPGEAPDGSKAVKSLEWLRRINKESGSKRLAILGRLIENYMEEDIDATALTRWQSQELIDIKKKESPK